MHRFSKSEASFEIRFSVFELEGMILGVILNPKNILLKSIEVFISYIYLVDGGRDGSEAINISGQS